MGYGKTNQSPIQIDNPGLDQINQTINEQGQTLNTQGQTIASQGQSIQTNAANITTNTTNIASNAAQLADKANQEVSRYQKPCTPIYFEQFFRTWYGRGQLTAEIPFETMNKTTNISQNYSVGNPGIIVNDASGFFIGSIIAMEYDDGTHDTYWVNNISGNTLTIYPPLRKNVTTNTKVQRAWYNAPHAGDFTLQYIGEQLANARYDDVVYGQTIFELNMNESDVLTKFKKLGNSTISVNNEASIIGSSYGSVLGTVSNNSISIVGNASGDGYRTINIPVNQLVPHVINVWIRANVSTSVLNVKSSDGTLITSLSVPGHLILEPYKLTFIPPAGTSEIYLEFMATTTGTTGIYVDDLAISENNYNGYILPRKGNILMLFDSWGNYSTYGIQNRLQALLPDANIINKGIGGNTATDMLNRFDTDVTPNNPDVVIIDTGVNDAYAMTSDDTTSYLSNLRQLINKCKEINAVPIFMGMPALAETDPRQTQFTQWQLTNRSRKMVYDAKRSMRNYKLNKSLKRIDVPISATSLAQNGQVNICVGTVNAGDSIKVKLSGGYLLSSTVKLQVGLSDALTNALVGTANLFDLTTTNYYEKTTGNIEYPEFYIKNNTGAIRFVIIRLLNTGSSAYTGSGFVSLEL